MTQPTENTAFDVKAFLQSQPRNLKDHSVRAFTRSDCIQFIQAAYAAGQASRVPDGEYVDNIREAFFLGFYSSGESYNGEYPFKSKSEMLANRHWIDIRDERLSAMLSASPKAGE